MTTEEFDTLISLYKKFKLARQYIFQTLQRMADLKIERMTPLDKIGDGPVVFECVRLNFKIDKKILMADKEERDRMCAQAIKEWRAEIQAEEDELERGRERNRIEQEKLEEKRERELYKKLKEKYGKRRRP